MSSTGPTSSSRALEAILPLVAAGQPYEAHQKARTFAARYTKSGAHAITIDVLFQSARELLKAGNPGSGTDLTLLLLESYERADEPVRRREQGCVHRHRDLRDASKNPLRPFSSSLFSRDWILSSYRWSAKQGGYPAGDPALQHYIGDLLHKENDFVGAEPHLLAAGTRDSARLLAQVYFDWAKASNSLESHAGTFALRAVLPYLLNGNILAARTSLGAFISYITFTPDPLLNFAQLAVRSVQRATGAQNKTAREAWIRLCGTYQSRSALLAQPEIRVVLDELGTLYFDLQPPRTANANPFGDIMSSLFGGAPDSSVSATAPRTITPGVVRAQLALD
ncbi:cytoplasmic protein [Lactarius hatsudake]|nr:cytoplasmic protein [Lactarius hatsudake]